MADPTHWLYTYADPAKIVIGGHSNGGVNASGLLVDRPTEIQGIVYFASYTSNNILLPQDVSNYTGKVLSLAGSEDNTSTPSDCKNGFNAYTSASCKNYALITGMGHGGFGDYIHSSQLVGTIGRTDATATVRHYLLSFMLSLFTNNTAAFDSLTQTSLQPNTTGEFISNCGSTVETPLLHVVENKFALYPNPASEYVYIDFNNHLLLNLQVYNMAGQKVIEQQLISSDKINVKILDQGKYLVLIEGENGIRKIYSLIKK